MISFYFFGTSTMRPLCYVHPPKGDVFPLYPCFPICNITFVTIYLLIGTPLVASDKDQT